MSDLIDRQAAIDRLTEYGNGRAVFISVGEAIIRIEQLPPAPPEYLAEQAGILVTDADTISRQAVIDLLKQMRKDGDMVPWEGKNVFARIRKMPSAQPDIIRCLNCKFASGDSRICMKFGHSPIGELDFCAWAERRTDEA